ncbi:hypothetical protein C22711_1997 [Escherichia coli O104:H4 str. C227-11]|nr:hypothetical protein C22711_1997 [Escherichia coli O104:H4 str. C227-11]
MDASAFRLYADGKVQGDADMVFYGQPRNDDGTVSLVSEGQYSTFTVALNRLKPDVQKIAFTVTCDGGQTVSGLRNLSIDVEQGATGLVSGSVELSGRQEAALILGNFTVVIMTGNSASLRRGSTVDLNRWQSISA